VRRDQHVQPHMLVLQHLFDFVTGALRSGATIRTFETVSGYRTTYAIQGDAFVATYDSVNNYVADNKREAGSPTPTASLPSFTPCAGRPLGVSYWKGQRKHSILLEAIQISHRTFYPPVGPPIVWTLRLVYIASRLV
jgi:hypothetical protein